MSRNKPYKRGDRRPIMNELTVDQRANYAGIVACMNYRDTRAGQPVEKGELLRIYKAAHDKEHDACFNQNRVAA